MGDKAFSVLLGNGDGAFRSQVSTAYSSGFPEDVIAADLNGDGLADVVVSDIQDDFVLLYLKLVDVTGDSRLDLVGTQYNLNRVIVLPGSGDGTFRSPRITKLKLAPLGLGIGDFNGDGKLDLALNSEKRQLYGKDYLVVALGNGNGTFNTGATVGFGSGLYGSAFSVAVGDFNSDSALDLAGGPDGFNPRVLVLYGSGEREFPALAG